MEKKHRFIRSDHLAAAVCLFTKQAPEIKVDGDQVFYGYPDNAELDNAINRYYDGDHISLNEYSTVLKRLISLRRRAGGR